MDMRVMFHFLIPGVEDTEKADLGAEMFGITGNFDQRFGTGTEQQRIDKTLVLKGKRCQKPGQCEHDVNVAGGEKFLTARLDPALAGVGLTLGTMPITARVVRDGAIAAARALIHVPAENGGAAAFNGPQDFQVLAGEPLSAGCYELLSRGADDIGHLKGWPLHPTCSRVVRVRLRLLTTSANPTDWPW